jgi:hypothetical protein
MQGCVIQVRLLRSFIGQQAKCNRLFRGGGGHIPTVLTNHSLEEKAKYTVYSVYNQQSLLMILLFFSEMFSLFSVVTFPNKYG